MKWLLLIFSLIPQMILHAQEPAPATGESAELSQLRQQFTVRALAAAKTLAEQFANALATIAKETGASGDYEQALAATRRREGLADLYNKSLNDPRLSNIIVLKPSDARVNGAVLYDRTENTLTGWKTVGSVASWDVARIAPGAYDITLTYGVADLGEPGRPNPFLAPPDLNTGGEFEFYEDSSLTGAGQNRRIGQVTTTGGWTNFVSLVLPAIQLSRSTAKFVLKITRTRGTGGVMHLREIRLSPVRPVSATGPATTDPAGTVVVDEFTKLQQTSGERLKAAVSSVVTPYVANVNALAEKIAATDADAAEDLCEEALRAAALAENPTTIFTNGPGRRTTVLMSATGSKELGGALYVESEANTGDRFIVRHGLEEFPVRLMWVRCPPASPSDATTTQAFADYFGITPDDVVTLGQQAKKFTAQFLRSRPLKLLTRGTKDAEGALLVAVHPAGVGDFASVLVDHGLAAIQDASGKSKSGRAREATILQALKDRETSARARTIPPGGWAMRAAP
ncbi:MAG: hypothetical protein ACOYMN_16970 [Roseimicrobium sp.]